MTDNSSVLTFIDDGKYPHIGQELAATFREIGATEKQWEAADIKAKDKIDKLLVKYKYVIQSEATGGPNPKLLKVLVIGATGSGKSATANSLIGHKWCEEGSSAESVTSMACTKVVTIDNTDLVVGDTPRSWEPQASTLDAVDCYVFVINLASPRFSQETLREVKSLKWRNGSPIVESGRFMVVLSHADSALQQISLRQYLDEIRGDPLHTFLTQVAQGRVQAVNNAAETEYQRRKQQETLFYLLLQVYHQPMKEAKSLKTSLIGGVNKLTSFTKRMKNKVGLMSGSPRNEYSIYFEANHQEHQSPEQHEQASLSRDYVATGIDDIQTPTASKEDMASIKRELKQDQEKQMPDEPKQQSMTHF